MTDWFKVKILGRMRVSTLVLIVAFIALFWVHDTFKPTPAPQAPAPAVVPPGFVPDPNYTWVPRTNVRRPKEPATTTSTTTTTTTTPSTTSPTETTGPTSTSGTPTETSTPTTTVIDPDGPGPIPPQTVTLPAVPTVGSPPPLAPALAPTPTTAAPAS
jgi:hypothetical protein